MIIYKNQDNEKLIFKIKSSITGKTIYQRGTFVADYVNKYFYFDRQEIKMWFAEGLEFSQCEINIQKYPVNADYNITPPIIGSPKFYGYFYFPLWNGYFGTDKSSNSISINFDKPTISMIINGKTYTKVRKFESNKTEILQANNQLPAIPRNVNVIYYDDNFA